MTTSITDARFTSLHYTPGHLLSLTFDEPPETGWSVMPGYDQSLPIPPHLEPPRLDADETLPSQLHPSYPFGRPPTLGRPRSNKPYMNGPTNLLGTIGAEEGIDFALGSSTSNWSRGGGWDELGLMGILEPERRKEVPPGMAGAKRPPSPPSPSLIPGAMPPPRSQHLRNLYARQRQGTPPPATDPFDAPVPNETYAEGEAPAHQQSQQRPQHTHQGQQSQGAPTFTADGGSTVGERIVGIRGGRVSDEGLQGTRPTSMTQRTPSYIGGRHRGTQEDDRMGDMSADDNGESFSTRE